MSNSEHAAQFIIPGKASTQASFFLWSGAQVRAAPPCGAWGAAVPTPQALGEVPVDAERSAPGDPPASGAVRSAVSRNKLLE